MHLLNKIRLVICLVVFFNATPFLADAQKYRLSGTIINQSTQERVPFAQVAVYDAKMENIKTGGVTDEQGIFRLELASGNYNLLISFVGYEDYTQSIQIKDKSLNLGEIAIQESEKMLDEIVVEANEIKQPIQATMEGMEINPQATIANIGGTLLDILRNTPSVSVSDDGAVSLRGSGSTNVLIDGRNSALATDLEQIPASAIEKIEIINNPNARYDASSDGGVINIVLKKGEDLGSNARVEITGGTRMRTNANINASHRTERFSVYGGYSYRSWPRVGWRETVRETFDDRQQLTQYQTDQRNDQEHTINYGLDYFFGKNRLSLEGVFNTEAENDFSSSSVALRNIDNQDLILSYVRNNNEKEDNKTFDNSIIYERDFNDPDKSLRALVSVSIRDQFENQDISVFNNTLEIGNREANRYERSFTDEFRNTSVIQADYTSPLLGGFFETGYKSIFRKFDNDYNYGLYDPSQDLFTNFDSISNRFIYQDQIHAAYAIFADSLPNFNYAVGLRAEQTFVDTRLVDTNENNRQSYLNFFPSVQMAYALNEMNVIKATYSRRIDRPSAWRLNPFPDFADSLNVRVGDPNLQPEYINSFELGHMFTKGGFSLTSNAFYRRIDGQVDWIVRVEDGISYRGPQNLNVSHLYGLELINTTEITKWWNMNASISLFESQIDGTNLNQDFTNRGFSWYAKMTTDINLPWGINMQFTGNYYAPEIEAQGRDLARYWVDGSLQRYFLDKKITLSASFRDMFDIRNFRGENYGSDFEQRFESKRETRIILITAAYTFKNEQ